MVVMSDDVMFMFSTKSKHHVACILAEQRAMVLPLLILIKLYGIHVTKKRRFATHLRNFAVFAKSVS